MRPMYSITEHAVRAWLGIVLCRSRSECVTVVRGLTASAVWTRRTHAAVSIRTSFVVHSDVPTS